MPISFAPFGNTRYFRHNKRWYKVVYEGKSATRAKEVADDYRSREYSVVGLTSNGKLESFARAAFDFPRNVEFAIGVWRAKR